MHALDRISMFRLEFPFVFQDMSRHVCVLSKGFFFNLDVVGIISL